MQRIGVATFLLAVVFNPGTHARNLHQAPAAATPCVTAKSAFYQCSTAKKQSPGAVCVPLCAARDGGSTCEPCTDVMEACSMNWPDYGAPLIGTLNSNSTLRCPANQSRGQVVARGPTQAQATLNPQQMAALASATLPIRTAAQAALAPIGCTNEGLNNIGCNNRGNNNQGDNNIGDNNYGDNNVGNSNFGSNNIGNGNHGSCNQGDDNSGNNLKGNQQRGNGTAPCAQAPALAPVPSAAIPDGAALAATGLPKPITTAG